jgi:pilus assembly protein Flp/PilA
VLTFVNALAVLFTLSANTIPNHNPGQSRKAHAISLPKSLPDNGLPRKHNLCDVFVNLAVRSAFILRLPCSPRPICFDQRREEVMFAVVARQVIEFLKAEEGPTAVEYAVMLALIIVICLAAITALGTSANATFGNVGSAIGAAGS